MNLYLPSRMLISISLLGIILVFFLGCGSKTERNPLFQETQNITKEEKVKFIVEAVAVVNERDSDGNKYSASFSRNLAPRRSTDKNTDYVAYYDPNYDPRDDWEGPDSDKWYTWKCYDENGIHDENQILKLRFTRADGQIIMYPAKSEEFLNRVLEGEDRIIRKETIFKYTTLSGKMYDFYYIDEHFFDVPLDDIPSPTHSTYMIGTATIPLNDQSLYHISIIKDAVITVRKHPDPQEFVLWEYSSKVSFTTSDNWKGEIIYASSESFQGNIEDETGTKIAALYYERGRPGADYYYIMLDDPERKRHELDIPFSL